METGLIAQDENPFHVLETDQAHTLDLRSFSLIIQRFS